MDKLHKGLRRSEKLEKIVNHIEVGLIVLDSNESINYINPAARQLFAVQEKEVEGKNIFTLIENEDLKELISMQHENPSADRELYFEDNRVFMAQCAPIPGVGVSVTLQNITHLKKIDRMKNDFVNTVSHDLRSPLTAITGYVDLLERVGPLNEKQKEFIRSVQSSVGTITALINDLLELGRIEAGASGFVDNLQFDNILDEALESYKLQIEGKAIDLDKSIAGNVPAMHGNPLRIRQLIDNLLGNALKYSPENGKILASLKVEFGQLIFQVSDDGPGIPVGDQPHIFEKFFRGSNISTKVNGSGLGLSIVKSIVDLHRGQICVDSPEDGGAVFTITFPIVKETGQHNRDNPA
ncbi:MAG TPA: ATP-binding protein [Anaerolineales bacterium]|nr:ATP-binding protein [Anaerolineales bacterium]